MTENVPRTVNIPGRIWDAACAAAADHGDTVDQVVLVLLTEYVQEHAESTRQQARARAAGGESARRMGL